MHGVHSFRLLHIGWVYASWILAVGINATVFPLNGEEAVFDRISATSAKDEHKKILFIVLFCFDEYSCIFSFHLQ